MPGRTGITELSSRVGSPGSTFAKILFALSRRTCDNTYRGWELRSGSWPYPFSGRAQHNGRASPRQCVYLLWKLCAAMSRPSTLPQDQRSRARQGQGMLAGAPPGMTTKVMLTVARDMLRHDKAMAYRYADADTTTDTTTGKAFVRHFQGKGKAAGQVADGLGRLRRIGLCFDIEPVKVYLPLKLFI